MNYKFIVINHEKEDYYYFAFKEVKKLSYSLFDNYYCPQNVISQLFYRLCFSERLNKLLNIPFKNLWLKKRLYRYSRIFDNNQNIVFFILSKCLKFEKSGLSKILKNKYPHSKIVYFLTDLVEKDKYKIDFLNNYRKIADLIYSFDYSDSEKFNLKFHNIPYSDLSGLFDNIEMKYDISFVGKVKDRLDDIINAYKALKKQNLKLGFYIVGVPKEKQFLADEINYCDYIPYKNYLRIVAESKCILEIMQKGGTGNTIRVSEAISFDKLLISNNKMLLQNSFYDSKYMRVYEKLEDLNVKEFIDTNKEVLYENKEKIYPSAFFKQIEKDLKELELEKSDKKNLK